MVELLTNRKNKVEMEDKIFGNGKKYRPFSSGEGNEG